MPHSGNGVAYERNQLGRVKGSNGSGRITLKKNLVGIYALAVCFFTVACFVIVAGITAWNVVELSAPEFTIDNYVHEAHASDENYGRWNHGPMGFRGERIRYLNPESVPAEPMAELQRKNREESWQQALAGERRAALQSLVRNAIILVIALLVFLAHWMIATRSREQ
jgi:hypothetical protein